jgi:AraC family transcriptional regulator of arabinose operon
VYAPGSSYGPRIQHSVQLVVVHSGRMTVGVDGVPHTAGAMTASVLLPGHEERFVFAAAQPTHHSWIHFWDLGPTSPLTARLRPLVDPIPLSRPLAGQVRGLLDLSASRLPTRTEIETLIARQALYQFIGEAEIGLGGDTLSGPVRRGLHAITTACPRPSTSTALPRRRP